METIKEGLPTQQKLMELIRTKVGSLLGAQLPGNFIAFTDAAGFNYAITHGANAWYNDASLKTLDARFESGGDLPHLAPGTFSGLYHDMLKSLLYVFSDEDTKTMNDGDAKTDAQISSVITAFTNAGWTFPNPLPPETPSKFSYALDFIAKTFGDVTKIPDTFNELRNALATYQEIAAASFILHKTAA
jgi:hypothetical protein